MTAAIHLEPLVKMVVLIELEKLQLRALKVILCWGVGWGWPVHS